MGNSYIPPYGHRHIPPGSDKDKIISRHLDRTVLRDYEKFVNKVNERTLFQRGILSSYSAPGDPALGLDVEYFHPSITADDRMVYIMENIVSVPGIDWRNAIGNTVISHFYGARGVHSVLTGESDTKKAHVDFVQLAKDQINFKSNGIVGAYTEAMRNRSVLAKTNKEKIWGTTELHTSIQTAGRRFVNTWYKNEPRHADKGTWLNVAEWVASWLHQPSQFNSKKTVMEGLAGSTQLKEAYSYLTGENLIGEYYGYHCSTSNSVNPALKFTHDDVFVAPGPGAKETLEVMFPKLSTKLVSYGDRVVWIRENQHQILSIKFHPSLWNYTNSYNETMFEDKQNELKSYGTEVSLCQYSVYCRLRANPALISKRKIARTPTTTNQVCTPKNLQESKEEENLEMEKGNWMSNLITNVFVKKNKPATIPDTSVPVAVESTPAATVDESVSLMDFSVTDKEEIVLNAIQEIGRPCTHQDVLANIKINNLDHKFKLNSNWKETWTVMQKLVKKSAIKKEGKHYFKND